MTTTLTTLLFILTSLLCGQAQTCTIEDKLVDCGNITQLFDPYYTPGVTFTWTGSSKDGKTNGQGVATKYVNGKFESKYDGSYRNGIREGKGIFTHVDGSVKTGIFVNGQLVGKGTMKDENGNSYEGNFINYHMHGNGIFRYGNGSSFVGFMVNDAESISMQANPERQVSGGIYTGFAPMSDNIISVMTNQRNPGHGVVTLLFGFKDWDNLCAFSINGNQYSFIYKKNGVVVQNDDWKESPAIKPDANEFN